MVYPEAPSLRAVPPVPQEMSQSPSAEKACPRWSWNHHFSLHSSSAFWKTALVCSSSGLAALQMFDTTLLSLLLV